MSDRDEPPVSAPPSVPEPQRIEVRAEARSAGTAAAAGRDVNFFRRVINRVTRIQLSVNLIFFGTQINAPARGHAQAVLSQGIWVLPTLGVISLILFFHHPNPAPSRPDASTTALAGASPTANRTIRGALRINSVPVSEATVELADCPGVAPSVTTGSGDYLLVGVPASCIKESLRLIVTYAGRTAELDAAVPAAAARADLEHRTG